MTVVAHLLPEEIIAARRLRTLKKRIGYALALLVVLLAAGYGLCWMGTQKAQDQLDGAQAQTVIAQHALSRYTPLLTTQHEAAAIAVTLSGLMVGDVDWHKLLASVRAAAPAGITVTALEGSVADPRATTSAADTGTGLSVLNQSGQQDIGTLGIAGTAKDKDTVAAYVDALARVKGLTAPFPAAVTTAQGSVTFDVNVLITKSAFSQRYATNPATPRSGN